MAYVCPRGLLNLFQNGVLKLLLHEVRFDLGSGKHKRCTYTVGPRVQLFKPGAAFIFKTDLFFGAFNSVGCGPVELALKHGG